MAPPKVRARYQRAWTNVPLYSVTPFLALADQSMKAGRSSQFSIASRQWLTHAGR